MVFSGENEEGKQSYSRRKFISFVRLRQGIWKFDSDFGIFPLHGGQHREARGPRDSPTPGRQTASLLASAGRGGASPIPAGVPGPGSREDGLCPRSSDLSCPLPWVLPGRQCGEGRTLSWSGSVCIVESRRTGGTCGYVPAASWSVLCSGGPRGPAGSSEFSPWCGNAVRQ